MSKEALRDVQLQRKVILTGEWVQGEPDEPGTACLVLRHFPGRGIHQICPVAQRALAWAVAEADETFMVDFEYFGSHSYTEAFYYMQLTEALIDWNDAKTYGDIDDLRPYHFVQRLPSQVLDALDRAEIILKEHLCG